ncbi:MAG: TIGR00366 family protein [Myxococcota bacterium]|nr:TIGR00366 family protein [Myxococcota bacterium]
MIAALGKRLSKLAERWIPDPFVLAIGLTLAVFIMSWAKSGQSNPLPIIDQWIDGSGKGKGFWNLLSFSMQMCLILLTGFALAETKLIRSLISRVAQIPKTTRSAVVVVSLTAMSFALLNWGLGLIIGALIAREVGRTFQEHGRPIHYPIVCAAGYTGLAVWHAGFSGSAPLKATSASQLREILGPELANQIKPILLQQTIGSSLNLVVVLSCLVIIPLTLFLMSPKEPVDMVSPPGGVPDSAPAIGDGSSPPSAPDISPAQWLNQSFLVVLFPSVLGLAWCIQWAFDVGLGKLNPNVINLFMLSLGLLLHGSAKAYVACTAEAVKSCSGIILQYPFYAGIMGIMFASGFVAEIGAWMSGLGPTGLAVSTFYSGGLVNLFVPSGGGQWAVQGSIVMQAALDANADPAVILMALAYGDQWTNLIQPFWALPLLGICRVKASEIIGYTAVLLFISQACFLGPLIFFA